MWKKGAYGFLGLLAVYFLYVIFFKNISVPQQQMEKQIKTKKVVYRLKDDAIIYADEQIGAPTDDIIKFKGVIVDLTKKNMMISAKNATVETKTSNLTFEGKVFGKSKDNKWNLMTERAEYKKEGDRVTTTARTKVVNNEKKMELEADRVETTTAFKEVKGIGNVIYKQADKNLNSNEATYYDDAQKINAVGNVVYKDSKGTMNSNSAIYDIVKKQVEATGNVKYQGKDLMVTAAKAYYDETTQITRGTGGGTFHYKPKNITGSYVDGVYDLKNELLTTGSKYVLNYDGYVVNGTNMVYAFKAGDATLNSNFAIRKQNFVISGTSGNINTNSKNIFSNNMMMRSDQGDVIKSKTGEGNFEKREFKFDGNVNGKIRGNVKDFVADPKKMVDSEAIYFRGNTAKVYFLVHKNKDYSVTRSEIKGNVNMNYKEINLNSQYNEIDTSKNLIMARDKVMMNFRGNTQMTSNFIYLDLNTEKGYAQNNVKIVSNIDGIGSVNISADKATIDNKARKLILDGNVETYRGKTKVTSKKATYYVDQKILENEQNIKINYYLQKNDSNTQTTGKADPKDTAAVDNVYSRLNINADDVKNNTSLNLVKSMVASNGVNTQVKWTSSNINAIDVTGKINKQFYGGTSKTVTLNANIISKNSQKIKSFNLTVPSETVLEMLKRGSSNIYIPVVSRLDTEITLPRTVGINTFKGMIQVPVTWKANGTVVRDSINVNANNSELEGTLTYLGSSYTKKYRIKLNQ